MEIQIINEKTNPLLNRREISLKVKEKATPSRVEVKSKLAALLNSKPELIVIERLTTIYGKQELAGKAFIYQSEERLKQLAHKHLVDRDAPKAKEGGEAPAEKAKEPEVKAEQKAEAKPETKAEPKPEAQPKAEVKAESKPEAKPKAEAKAEGKKKSEEK